MGEMGNRDREGESKMERDRAIERLKTRWRGIERQRW